MTKKHYLLILISHLTLLSCSNDDDLSYYLINKQSQAIEIVYDDRMYRSDLESDKPTMDTLRIKPDSSFFLGIGSFKEESIWPGYLEIRTNKDTIKLNGREAIYARCQENKIVIK